MNKIKISTPKISLFNNIKTPPTYSIKCTLAITDSGANIHIENKITPKIALVIISNNMNARILYGITMGSSHIATLQLPYLTPKAIQLYIFPKIRTSPLISLGSLGDCGYTVTLD